MILDADFQDAADKRRFELDVAGQTVFADYDRCPGTLVIRYVYAPPALRGRGFSDRLMGEIVRVARADGLKIVALCGYARAWLHGHKAHRDLLA